MINDENKKRIKDRVNSGLNKVQHIIMWKNIPLNGSEFEKCKILKGSILTQEEQMQLYEHNKHFHFDKSTNLHNKLILRNIRPMR